MIRGTKAVSHDQGCLHPPADTEEITRTLINLGKNPNVGAALVIGLGCELVSAEEVYEGIKSSRKPVDFVAFHKLGGMFETISKGPRIAADFVVQISGIRGVVM
jgi:altronate dehydratase large subunit